MDSHRTPRHGTRAEYVNHRCRCEACTAANTAARRQWRAVARLEPGNPRHGTINGYQNYSCRCPACTEAARIACMRYRKARRDADR